MERRREKARKRMIEGRRNRDRRERRAKTAQSRRLASQSNKPRNEIFIYSKLFPTIKSFNPSKTKDDTIK